MQGEREVHVHNGGVERFLESKNRVWDRGRHTDLVALRADSPETVRKSRSTIKLPRA
jgi:hypothetical protein